MPRIHEFSDVVVGVVVVVIIIICTCFRMSRA